MKIDLDEDQLKILEKHYGVPNDPRTIDYSKFLGDINSVFTATGLDKDPLLKPQEFRKATHLDPNDILTDFEE